MQYAITILSVTSSFAKWKLIWICKFYSNLAYLVKLAPFSTVNVPRLCHHEYGKLNYFLALFRFNMLTAGNLLANSTAESWQSFDGDCVAKFCQTPK